MSFLLGMVVGALAAGAFAWLFPGLFKTTADEVDAKLHDKAGGG